MRNIVVVLLVFIGLTSQVLGEELSWEDISRGNVDFSAVLSDLSNRKLFLSGAKGVVLKSEDGGLNWRRVLSAGTDSRINLLVQDKKSVNIFYALTTSGLYLSNNSGNNWRRIFRGKNYLENDCTSIAVSSNTLYLGTHGGLFLSMDNGRSWKKEAGVLGRYNIISMDSDFSKECYIYVVCAEGVFRVICTDGKWEKIFTRHISEEVASDKEEKTEEHSGEEANTGANSIGVCRGLSGNGLIYLATAHGVYQSQDKGANWEHLNDYGLLSSDTRKVVISKLSEVYVITRSGVFVYRDERWRELSLGLVPGEIRELVLDKDGNLYAACEKGLFRSKEDKLIKDSTNSIGVYSQKEPSIKEVQDAAIQYAEVSPEKISQWRKKAASKAILPEVSVALDRNTTDLWHWETGSTTKSDDDTLRQGNDSIDWGVKFTWDLGGLIWNEDQTSIDARSRLMVQLRGDILDEVNKLYFERLRVKMELDNSAIEDRRKVFDKELRLRELTASLDGLTGGYFSQHVR